MDPPSPLLLAITRPYYDFDDYLISSDEEEDEIANDFDEDETTNDFDKDETANGFDEDVPSMLIDSQIVDQYKALPLLQIDPALPIYLQSTPVYDSVEELLASSYPHLLADTLQYEWHLNRLKRNREYVNNCKMSMERRRSMYRSLPVTSPGPWGASGDCKRFRARR
ncbi:hypothetical protein D0Z03_002659 [Geotrichum reessii]|nr:hypothetical protein D0Z03_002659 [Galactomyces reessii]